MKKLIYPSEKKVIKNNFLILQIIKAKKADQSKVLSHSKLREIIEECKNNKGDIYDKAVILLRGLKMERLGNLKGKEKMISKQFYKLCRTTKKN